MGTEQNREAALCKLLTEMFDGDGAGLLRWGRLHLGKGIHDELPTGVSLSQLAFDATLAIQRHGLAKQAFASLLIERPVQAGHIQQVAMLWDVQLDSGAVRESAIPGSTTAMARLWRVPDLPPHYLTRQATIDAVVRALLNSDGGKVGISAAGPGSGITKTDKHGLHGMGGIGKSVLATAAARQPAIAERFTDGIFWLSVGQDPKLESLQAQLCQALGHTADFDHAADGKQRLRDILADKAVLLVLDDVWTAKHAGMLDVVGPQGSLLVTTRDSEVLTWLEARDYQLDIMRPEESLALLADWIQLPVTALPAEAARVADACGHLPVALATIGALVRRRQNWSDMLRLLDNARLTKLKGDIPGYDYDNVFQVIDVSVAALAAEPDGARARRCYVDLAVLPEDTPIPRAALRIAWARHGLDHYDVDELASTFADRALARVDQAGRLTLHDLQRLYARSQIDDLAALHSAFADAYLDRRGHATANHPDSPYAGLNDGYFFQHLPWHLTQAGRQDTLAALLFDFDWLKAKLDATSVTDLLADFSLLPASHAASREAKLVHDALRLSSHVVMHDTRQLPGQLIGRLGNLAQGHDRLAALLAQTRSMTRYRWLRPVTPSLTPPGGALLRTLVGHAHPVNAVVVTPDGRHAVSASDDRTLKLWDLEQGIELRTLAGHKGSVTAVAVIPDGRLVLSGSEEGKLKLWDLDQGTELRTLAGHADRVNAVAVTADGRRAVSVSRDGLLKLWDLEQGTELTSLAGQADSVNAVAVTPDGRLAISLSVKRTLTLWDLDEGTEIRTLGEPWVDALAVTPDGRRAVLAWREWTDAYLKLWDLEQGTELPFEGEHAVRIDVVAMTPDGRRAVSAAGDGVLKLWDLQQGTELCSLAGGASWFNAVAMAPGGQRVVSASRDGTLMMWDLEHGTKQRSSASGSQAYFTLTITPDGRRAVSVLDNGILKLWDLEHGTEPRTLAIHARGVTAMAVTSDGRLVLGARRDRTLKMLDLNQGTELRTLTVGAEWITAMAVTPDGRRAVVAADNDTLTLWDLECGTELRSLASHTGDVRGVAVTPDGRRAVSASDYGLLTLWDLERGTGLHTSPPVFHSIAALAVTPDGRRAISGHLGGILKLWDPEEGTKPRTLASHKGTVWAVAVTPDGQHAVSASEDHMLKLWDLDAGKVLATFTTDSEVTGVVCSSTAPVFVAVDRLGRIHILELVEPSNGVQVASS